MSRIDSRLHLQHLCQMRGAILVLRVIIVTHLTYNAGAVRPQLTVRVTDDVYVLGHLNRRHFTKLYGNQGGWGLHNLQQRQIGLLVLRNDSHSITAVLRRLVPPTWLEKDDTGF